MRKENGILLEVCSSDVELLAKNSKKFWKRVTSIGDKVFLRCSSLTNINIPESVTSIGDFAFAYCINLTNINISKGVTSIGKRAFYGCSNLTNISIPKGVTSIGKNAFYGVPRIEINDQSLCGDIITPELFELIKEEPYINLKQINKIYLMVKEKELNYNNVVEFINLSASLGILEPNSTTVEIGKNKNGSPNLVPVNNIAYTFIQGLIKQGDINLNELHMNLQEMKLERYNEAFMKFVINKTNWSDIKENLTILPRVYDWFKTRTNLDMTQPSMNPLLPTTEENRYRILVYDTAENGIDRMHWRVPTMQYLLHEFAKTKFSGIITERDQELAEEIGKFNIYSQKHFNKAKEIDQEREKSGVKDVLTKLIKQSRIKSLDEYRERTKALQKQILTDSAEILSDEIEDTSSIFTYEALSKSSPANFVMGCMTSCCATLYGAGAGAMRAMIIHPDIQPLVIRDFDNNIISFGIIYVNREKGYAVVNDFEVNKRYTDKDKRKAIYEKVMEGVHAFATEYNAENPTKPITRVTCGLSPNWTAINDFITKNPKSEILKAPNFDDFKYVGSGTWNGDWHKAQYEIWNIEERENEI